MYTNNKIYYWTVYLKHKYIHNLRWACTVAFSNLNTLRFYDIENYKNKIHSNSFLVLAKRLEATVFVCWFKALKAVVEFTAHSRDSLRFRLTITVVYIQTLSEFLAANFLIGWFCVYDAFNKLVYYKREREKQHNTKI